MNKKAKFLQISFIFSFIVSNTLTLFAEEIQNLPVVRIGIVMDGFNEETIESNKIFKHEIVDLLKGEFDVHFPPEKLILAEWKTESMKASVDTLLSDPDVDLILTLGFMSSNEVCTRGALPKPVIAPFTFDIEAQDLPFQNGTSGVKNLNYIATVSAVTLEIAKFREIVHFDKLAILFNHCPCGMIPEMCNRVRSSIQEMGIDLVKAHCEVSVEQALADIPEDAEAVYIVPLNPFLREDFEIIVQGLIERRLPSFSHAGRPDVERGILAGMATEIDMQRLARRVALNVQRILLGEDAGTLPVSFSRGEHMTLNMATARAIRYRPTWDCIGSSELINVEPEDVSRKLSLKGVLEEAVQANLELQTNTLGVAAGLQEAHLARADLLPNIEIGVNGLIIDRDRADGMFSMMAQRTLTGSAGLTQVVFSEPAWANLSIQKYLQQSREYRLKTKRMDIMLEAAVAYINVLRARTYQKIQEDNLKLTQSNLELARIRQSIGVSGPAELYRWENQIATITKDRINADTQRIVAEIAMNRLLHRPLEERFVIEDYGLDVPGALLSEERLVPYHSDPWSYRIFRDFQVQEGLAASPELRTVDSAIAAQTRALRSALYSFWAPTLALQAEASHLFAESGAGSETVEFQPPPLDDTDPLKPYLTGILGTMAERPDDTDLRVGLGLTFPLFKGGYRNTERLKAKTELARMHMERKAMAEQIEQRIRSSMHKLGSSYVGVDLAQDAANAAHKNLDLVRDSYSRGVVSIIDQLDAQNAALVSDLLAADAIYDCLLDYVEMQRACSSFIYFFSEKEREAFIDRIKAFFEEAEAQWNQE